MVARTQTNQVQHIRVAAEQQSGELFEPGAIEGFNQNLAALYLGVGYCCVSTRARGEIVGIFRRARLQHSAIRSQRGQGALHPTTNTHKHHTSHTRHALLLAASHPHVQPSIMSVLSAKGLPATGRGAGLPSRVKAAEKALPTRHQWSRMQTMPRPMRGSVRAEPNFQEGEWEVPNGYDYTKPTHGNYAAAAERTGEVYGNYKEVRATRDVDYHGIYSRERQLFQGEPSPTRRAVLSTSVARYCCSPMTTEIQQRSYGWLWCYILTQQIRGVLGSCY